MKLDSTFAVTAPIEQVWATLMDFEKVAGCVPGAQVLSQLSPDAYQVAMRVKLGPVTMQYRGQMEVAERDAAGHRALLTGQAKEARGQGTAAATASLPLVADGDTTRGTVAADVQLSGRAAAMGQSIIGSVTDQMMTQFAQNLQVMLNDAEAVAAPGAADLAPALADDLGPALSAADAATPPSRTPAAAAPPPASPGGPGADAASSLDGLALARGIAVAQLQDPGRVLQLVALVAGVAYALGRRAARRDRDRWVTLLASAVATAQRTE